MYLTKKLIIGKMYIYHVCDKNFTIKIKQANQNNNFLTNSNAVTGLFTIQTKKHYKNSTCLTEI